MFTRDFWLGDSGALVRAVRTFAQTSAAMLTVSTFSPFEVGQWSNVLVVSATAAVVSLLMSLDRREALNTAPPALVAAATVSTTTTTPGVYVTEVESTGCGGDMR